MDGMDDMDDMDGVSRERVGLSPLRPSRPWQPLPPYSFLSRYRFPSASSEVPTMSRNETELMTGVEPSRTCR
ncbi:hypothetical protein JCM14713_24940 [Desulfomicrobium salsuginis]